MSSYQSICMRLCAVLFVFLFCSTAFGGSAKVEVCHIPPDNPDHFHTIKITENALANHLDHGDLVGACEAGCATLCDDGDACTIDDTGDCFENGCPIDREPVDCSDGSSCTNDSCDSVAGTCVNQEVICTPSDNCHVSFCAEGSGCQETEVSCGGDQVCDLDSGECVDPVPTDVCPCFTAESLGTANSCDVSANEIIAFFTGYTACSGEDCTLGTPGVECALLDVNFFPTEYSDANSDPAFDANLNALCLAELAISCGQ